MKTYDPFVHGHFAGAHLQFLLPSEPEKPTVAPMTVCIGILCMDGKAVVMAADKRVSHPSMKYATESQDCKIAQLSPRRLLASAGEPPSANFLEEFRRASRMDKTAEEMAKVISITCSKMWRERMGQATTEWMLGMDYDTFIARSKDLEKHIVEDVWRQIGRVPASNSYLLAVSDSSGAHLSAIAEREGYRLLDSLGFGAIGVGSDVAMPVLFRKPHVRSWAIPDAIYLAYEAKRAAENSPMVGKETDMAVILPGQDVYFLGSEAMARLEQIYNSKEPPGLTKSEIESIQALLPAPKS